jgi:hypothetical protein
VAFTSSTFRRKAGDNPSHFEADIVWAVSVDGRQWKRLSPPLPEDYDKGPGCVGDSTCPLSSHCLYTSVGGVQERRCVRVNLDVSYGHPTWSRDGQTLYFEEGFSVDCNPYIVNLNDFSNFHLCMYSIVQSVSDSAFRSLPRDRYCYDAVPLAFNPRAEQLLVNHESCKGAEALREFSVQAGTDSMPVKTLELPAGLLDRDDAAWLPDGSGLLLVAAQTKKTVVNAEGYGRRYRVGVHRWSEGTGFARLYESATDDTDIGSLAVSSSGEVVVEVIRTVDGKDSSQIHLFDARTGTIGDALTRGDSNGQPDW